MTYDAFAFEITAAQLKERRDRGDDFTLLDVREVQEFAIANLGGTLIPLSELSARCSELDPDKETVVMCHHGIRSAHHVAGGRPFWVVPDAGAPYFSLARFRGSADGGWGYFDLAFLAKQVDHTGAYKGSRQECQNQNGERQPAKPAVVVGHQREKRNVGMTHGRYQ